MPTKKPETKKETQYLEDFKVVVHIKYDEHEEGSYAVRFDVKKLDGYQGHVHGDYPCDFIDGFVRFDGCSNWNIDRNGSMTHFCSKEEIGRTARLIEALFDIAVEIMGDNVV